MYRVYSVPVLLRSETPPIRKSVVSEAPSSPAEQLLITITVSIQQPTLLSMVKPWLHTLHLEDVFYNDELPYEQIRDTIVERIRQAEFYTDTDEELVDAVMGLATAEVVVQFDYYWDDFYDWCDDGRKVWVSLQ